MKNKIELDLNKGQHMLIDKKIIKREIAVADLKKSDKVLEIGAGSGNLTIELCKKAEKVVAFEIDEKFEKDLNELTKKYNNLSVIFDNALNYNWKDFDKIVSNIPYHLSEAIINKAIESNINELVLIIGDNFKEKLFSDEKIRIIAKKFYNIKLICKVERENFEPIPKVDSWLVCFKKNKEISKKDEMLLEIALAKGKVKNAIIKSLIIDGKTKKEAKQILNEMDLNKQSLNKPAQKITARLLFRIEKGISNINIKSDQHV